ncbi:MAG: HAD family hydrolase [Oligoflexia bacterium]|nr:HAD family hydrolase [Oligoflexia bacterium]
MKKIKAIIFDLDGTLVNTVEDITKAVNQVLSEYNYPLHSINECQDFIGEGVEKLMLLASPYHNLPPSEKREQILREMVERFNYYYQQCYLEKSKPYPGITSLLDRLVNAKIPLAILSNKTHSFVVQTAKHLFKEEIFAGRVFGAGTNFPRKPDPTLPLHLCREMTGRELGRRSESTFETFEDCLFVGDSDIDINTAKNAGMLSVAVSWGFQKVDHLKKFDPWRIVNTAEELLKNCSIV